MTRKGDRPSRTRLGACALLVLCLVLAACNSTYGRLRPESEIPECRSCLQSAEGIPRVTRLVPAGEMGGRPVRLAVEEVGTGDRERMDVLLHGVLSDRRTWRYVASALSPDHDVLLVDLPGCGQSDKPDPTSEVSDDDYCPTALGRHVFLALRKQLGARRAPTRLTLVGHSLGSAIILRMLGAQEFRDEFADVLACVDRAVLLSPITFAVEKKPQIFDRIAGLSAAEIAVAEAIGTLRGATAHSVWTGVSDPRTAPREEADRLHEVLSHGETRRASQAMLRAAVPFTDDGRCDWACIERLEDDYRNVTVPVLLVCGGRDETIPQAMSFRLRQLLPQAWLRVIPRAMHSLPTERPQECAQFVRDFSASGGEGWAVFDDARRDAEVPAALTH